MAKKEKRVRRTPEEARELILEAAEKAMGAEGPAALRLQDVAKAVGISHATILHHFGSREGLVKALHMRALDRLRAALLGQMGNADSANDGVAQSFAAFRDGMARSILWLMQLPPEDNLNLPPGGVAMIDQVARRLHELRVSFAPPGKTVDYADSLAVSHLVTVAAFGDALVGDKLRELSHQDAGARTRFERWLSALIDTHIRSYWD